MFSACKKLIFSLFVILLVSISGTAGSVQADVPPTSAEAACLIDADTAQNSGVDFAAVTTGATPASAFANRPHTRILSDLSELYMGKK